MNPVKTVTLMDHRWKIKFCPRVKVSYLEDRIGECDWESDTIRISDDLVGEILLDTTIHEATHVCFPFLEEGFVEKMSTDIARLLWRLGYRLPEEVKDDN